jgi:hypothetical protein
VIFVYINRGVGGDFLANSVGSSWRKKKRPHSLRKKKAGFVNILTLGEWYIKLASSASRTCRVSTFRGLYLYQERHSEGLSVLGELLRGGGWVVF